jgi:hypothetical protein
MVKIRISEIETFKKLTNLFLKSKKDNNDSKFLKTIAKKNPELAKVYSDWNGKMDKSVTMARDYAKKHGHSTQSYNKFLNKYR